TLPKDDAFYTMTILSGGSAPGAIMKHRTPPARISAVGFAAVNLENRHQILYRTNEFFGNVTTTVITVLVSYKVDRMIIISYQLA
ncbi:uncharacterized protein TRIVIDRAFT_8486, partial [Trichoderma virens Gv29-8]